MATQTVYFKEQEGIGHNPMGQLSTSWWTTPITSQSVYGESCVQLKSFTMEHPSGGDQLISNKQAGRGTEHGADRGNTTQFNIFPGNLLLLVLPCWWYQVS
jgi:nuclear transcription factor Y alpha